MRKRPGPGICHPKEAPGISCECGLSYSIRFAFLCFIIPLPSVVTDFEPCGSNPNPNPNPKQITHIILYQAMRYPGNTILQEFLEQ